MKAMTLTLQLFLLVGILLGQAHAEWPTPVRQAWLSYQTSAEGLENSAVATFWGGLRRYRFFTHNKEGQRQLPSPLFREGSFPIYLSASTQSDRLFVFMPGIFGQPNKGLTPQFIDLLEGIGGHVLVVPNLLAPDYVRAYPLYGEDLVAHEVAVMESALDYALKKLPQVKRIHVIAESLGTAIGSAWAAHDRTHQRRLSDLTLLWPPLDLRKAMTNFDAIIDQHRPYAASCSTLKKLSILARHFLWTAFPGKLQKDEEGCVGAMVMVDGFITATQRSWRAYSEAVRSSGTPPEGFEAYFRSYRPQLWQMLEQGDERLQLAHWFKRLKRDPHFPVRIATSQNDFLNRELSWDEFRREVKLSDDEFLQLSWGGHSGPVSVPRMQTLLAELFDEAALARQTEAAVAPGDAGVAR